MNSNPKTSAKKPCETPRLKVYGDIPTLTKGSARMAIVIDGLILLKT
jgi:hypothetical protein